MLLYVIIWFNVHETLYLVYRIHVFFVRFWRYIAGIFWQNINTFVFTRKKQCVYFEIWNNIWIYFWRMSCFWALPWLRRLVAGLWTPKHLFDPRLYQMTYFLAVFRFFPVSIIPLMLSIHLRLNKKKRVKSRKLKVKQCSFGCRGTLDRNYFAFLGAFAKLRKATVCLSVRLSAWNNSAPTGRIITKFDISIFFENTSRESKFHWSRTRITATLYQYQYTFFLS